MVTLEDLATKGKNKLSKKISIMQKNYEAAKDRAIAGYDATPFGPTRKSNYKTAWTWMPDNYKLKVKPGIEDKWYRNWIAAMRE